MTSEFSASLKWDVLALAAVALFAYALVYLYKNNRLFFWCLVAGGIGAHFAAGILLMAARLPFFWPLLVVAILGIAGAGMHSLDRQNHLLFDSVSGVLATLFSAVSLYMLAMLVLLMLQKPMAMRSTVRMLTW